MITNGNNLQPNPPDDRDRAIYRAIAIEGRSKKEVADRYSLSERSIRRIVRRTERYLATQKFREQREPSQVMDSYLKRLDHQWQEVMMAWYRSLADRQVTKVSKDTGGARGSEKVERVSHSQCGDIRYLEHARRVLADILQLCNDETNLYLEEHSDVANLTPQQREAELTELLDQLRLRAREDEDPGTDHGPTDDDGPNDRLA